VTGRASWNVWVLDLDIQKDPRALAWWQGLLAVHNNGSDLHTVEQITGGGGVQMLLRAPHGVVVPTCKTSIGVDVRGQGGFAVLPPSHHESGNDYAWKPGHAPWECGIAVAPQWLLDEIGTLAGASPGPSGAPPGGSPRTGSAAFDTGNGHDAFGGIHDGREEYMRDLIWAALIGLYTDSPIGPPSPAAMEVIWADYERNARPKALVAGETNAEGLEREGRGRRLFEQKWRAAIRHWDGEIAAEAAVREARDKRTSPDFEEAVRQAKANPGVQFELLDTNQILALPDPVWLIEELIIEHALGFIFGPPGSVKTFIGIGMALTFVVKRRLWWGRPVNQHGAVIYVSSEGHRAIKFRMQAWAKHYGVDIKDTPFFLLKESLSFMEPDDIAKLLATVEAAVKRAGMPIAAIFVDTVSKVLPGAEENLQKDMTQFVNACAKLREQFNTVVIGIHHTNAQGGFRGSTVMPGAGDFLIEVRREPGAKEGSIFAKKIKDAEDGWEQAFKVVEVSLDTLDGKTSLVVECSDEPTAKARGGWPDKDTCRRILAAIGQAWQAGNPWSDSPQSRDRYAPRIMWVRFEVPAKIARDMIDKWLINKVLAVEIRDFKSKIKGLRVVGDIDEGRCAVQKEGSS
jgi:hypothetical protein